MGIYVIVYAIVYVIVYVIASCGSCFILQMSEVLRRRRREILAINVDKVKFEKSLEQTSRRLKETDNVARNEARRAKALLAVYQLDDEVNSYYQTGCTDTQENNLIAEVNQRNLELDSSNNHLEMYDLVYNLSNERIAQNENLTDFNYIEKYSGNNNESSAFAMKSQTQVSHDNTSICSSRNINLSVDDRKPTYGSANSADLETSLETFPTYSDAVVADSRSFGNRKSYFQSYDLENEDLRPSRPEEDTIHNVQQSYDLWNKDVALNRSESHSTSAVHHSTSLVTENRAPLSSFSRTTATSVCPRKPAPPAPPQRRTGFINFTSSTLPSVVETPNSVTQAPHPTNSLIAIYQHRGCNDVNGYDQIGYTQTQENNMVEGNEQGHSGMPLDNFKKDGGRMAVFDNSSVSSKQNIFGVTNFSSSCRIPNPGSPTFFSVPTVQPLSNISETRLKQIESDFNSNPRRQEMRSRPVSVISLAGMNSSNN